MTFKKCRQLFYALLLATGLSLFPALAAKDAAATTKTVHVLPVTGVIGPASKDLLKRHIEKAENAQAAALILEMHTPGGLLTSTQDMVQDMIASGVPIITYVSPSGSHAASAGTFILYASHVAAMAPATNLGAATPINMAAPDASGKKDNEKDSGKQTGAIDKKAVNDAAAYIRGLAEMRGRNVDWAEKAVRDAASLSANEAKKQGVIDFVAKDLKDLLQQAHGKKVSLAGENHTLDLAGAEIERQTPDWRHELLSIITNPNVALLLMTLGAYGLIYEFANPGTFISGIIGTICLLLGLYALNVLPVNYAGLALVLLGIALMVGEAFAPSFGVLGIGGTAAFVIGSAILIDTDVIGFGISWWTIAGLALSSVVVLVVLLSMAVRSQRKPVTTGQAELYQATGEVLHWSNGKGEVRITGEVWHARAATDFILKPGDKVRVIDVQKLVLVVKPTEK